MNEPFALSELERDALSELMNMAMGQAAASLNQLIDEEVQLSIPTIELMTRSQFARRMSEAVGDVASTVRQGVKGLFSGEALLIFPEDQSLELVRKLLGSDISLEELTELEQDAFVEIGNIIVGTSVATLANTLGYEVTMSLPHFAKQTAAELGNCTPDGPDDIVLFVNIEFKLPDDEISGYLSFVMSAASAHDLKRHVQKYISDAMG